MTKIVTREHVPAVEVPESLRGAIPGTAIVTVTVAVEEADSEAHRERRRSAWTRYTGAAAERGTSIEEAVRRIRELRDEWE